MTQDATPTPNPDKLAENAAMEEASRRLEGTPGNYPTVASLHALKRDLLAKHWLAGGDVDAFKAAILADRPAKKAPGA